MRVTVELYDFCDNVDWQKVHKIAWACGFKSAQKRKGANTLSFVPDPNKGTNIDQFRQKLSELPFIKSVE